ncbi:MAG: phosphomannomutase/phosphoglucomutase [Eubacteriaceae bacterium]|jgi:phosphomannomutase|nr:phosphomannomutase/phosphoglucomutase [Eubacteriaceae bacterium]
MDLLELQNGSDIRGVAIASPDNAATLDVIAAEKIGAAFATWLKEAKGIIKAVISVGRDPRLSGKELSAAFIKGLYKGGAHSVYDFDICTTPAMFVSTQPNLLDCDAAAIATASHLPRDRNGFKLFTKEGGLSDIDIKAVLYTAQRDISYKPSNKTAQKANFLDTYAKTLVEGIQHATLSLKPFEGLKIMVDAGNGSGGFFAEKVLSPLGADTSSSQFLEPDGEFPNHMPNPDNQNVMDAFCQAVKRANVDLGIIFDTDVDRAAIVESDGSPIAKSKLIALVSEVVLLENPGSIIVTDSVTSTSLTSFIRARGGHHHRYRRGYSNVINEAKRLDRMSGNCALAIETSGHCAFKENNFLDDGAYLAVKALIFYSMLRKQGLYISDALSGYQDPLEELEKRVRLIETANRNIGAQIVNDFELFASSIEGWEIDEPNYEGNRAKTDYGWILVRQSLHEPELVVNIESDEAGGALKLYEKFQEFIRMYENSTKLDF